MNRWIFIDGQISRQIDGQMNNWTVEVKDKWLDGILLETFTTLHKF